MRKPKQFFCEVYKTTYYSCVRWPISDIRKFLIQQFDHDRPAEEFGGGYCMKVNLADGIVFLIWTSPEDKNNSYLVHECVHAAGWTLLDRGIKADFANDEALAYLTEFLFRKSVS